MKIHPSLSVKNEVRPIYGDIGIFQTISSLLRLYKSNSKSCIKAKKLSERAKIGARFSESCQRFFSLTLLMSYNAKYFFALCNERPSSSVLSYVMIAIHFPKISALVGRKYIFFKQGSQLEIGVTDEDATSNAGERGLFSIIPHTTVGHRK
ncbi:MAG: hypothetical protein AAF335_00730 [Bacteroidota bacterium]